MPSNPKPKADEVENEARDRGGETEEERKRRKQRKRSGERGRKKLRGRPKPERAGRRKEVAAVRRNLER